MLAESSSSSVQVTNVKLATGSLGNAACKFAEVPIDDKRQSLSFSGCALARGHDYSAVVYIEDIHHSDDGMYHRINFTIPWNDSHVQPLARGHTDISVSSGQWHHYHVRVVNHIGVGPASARSSAILAA